MKKLSINLCLLSIFLFTCVPAQSYVGELLYVTDTRYTPIETDAPSCKLIEHRAMASQTNLRELYENLKNFKHEEYARTYKYIRSEIDFTNKNWFENKMKVQYIVKTNELLKREILKHGINNLFLSIYSNGMKLSRQVNNHKTLSGMLVKYDDNSENIYIQYIIPKIEYCLNSHETPYISWVRKNHANKNELIKAAKHEDFIEKLTVQNLELYEQRRKDIELAFTTYKKLEETLHQLNTIDDKHTRPKVNKSNVEFVSSIVLKLKQELETLKPFAYQVKYNKINFNIDKLNVLIFDITCSECYTNSDLGFIDLKKYELAQLLYNSLKNEIAEIVEPLINDIENEKANEAEVLRPEHLLIAKQPGSSLKLETVFTIRNNSKKPFTKGTDKK